MDSQHENKNEKNLYEDIRQSVEKITSLCGTENIQDASLNLNNDEYSQYEEECKKIVRTIENIVRLQEKPFDFTCLLNEVADEEFWENIKHRVDRAVKCFLTVVPYRKLDEHVRLELLEKSFDIIYLQRESRSFLSEILGDELLSDAIHEILRESEFMIVANYASKRLFKNFVTRKANLDDKDLDVIWDLYEQNFSTVFTNVSLKNHFRLSEQIRLLADKIDELEDLLLPGFHD